VLDESLFTPNLLAGHRQLADVYLVALAKRNNGQLATFDRAIPVGAVVGATRATLSVIGATGDDK
jgi:predicted nucleic acid-binding protein